MPKVKKENFKQLKFKRGRIFWNDKIFHDTKKTSKSSSMFNINCKCLLINNIWFMNWMIKPNNKTTVAILNLSIPMFPQTKKNPQELVLWFTNV